MVRALSQLPQVCDCFSWHVTHCICRYQRMRIAAKVTTGFVCRFFKRKIYKNIKANVVCMSNCARRTIVRRPFMAAHLGLQHLKAHTKMRPLRQHLIAMRLAAACFKGPVFRYLYKRTSDAVKGISAVVKRCAPRQSLCARRNLILSLQARSRAHGVYVRYYVPLINAKKLKNVVRRCLVQAAYRRLLHAGLKLLPALVAVQDRISFTEKRKAVGVIQATRHLKSDRLAYLKCRRVHVWGCAACVRCVTVKCRSKFVAFAFVQGLDPKHPKNWTKVPNSPNFQTAACKRSAFSRFGSKCCPVS